MCFTLLSETPQHLRTVAQWLFGEWGDPARGHSLEQLVDRLSSRMSLDSLPMHLLALEQAKPVGFVALKLYEMESYPERKYWLGSLYVPPEKRGHGIASALIEELVNRAYTYRVACLSLQTERLDGGLYSRHGWQPVETAISHGDRVLVMERYLTESYYS